MSGLIETTSFEKLLDTAATWGPIFCTPCSQLRSGGGLSKWEADLSVFNPFLKIMWVRFCLERRSSEPVWDSWDQIFANIMLLKLKHFIIYYFIYTQSIKSKIWGDKKINLLLKWSLLKMNVLPSTVVDICGIELCSLWQKIIFFLSWKQTCSSWLFLITCLVQGYSSQVS